MNRDTFKLKSFDTFWLSENPFDISQANDTTNFRICGTAVLGTSRSSTFALESITDTAGLQVWAM